MDAEARTHATRLGWAGLGLMSVQMGAFARLTWWEYSWDIMEPVTYFATYSTLIGGFVYYLLTQQVKTMCMFCYGEVFVRTTIIIKVLCIRFSYTSLSYFRS